MNPLSIDSQAIVNVNDAGNASVHALSQTLTNFVAPMLLIALLTFIIWISYSLLFIGKGRAISSKGISSFDFIAGQAYMLGDRNRITAQKRAKSNNIDDMPLSSFDSLNERSNAEADPNYRR